ncbi:MAG: ferrous iron transport protein B [Deltaproteobacteria bacterium]|nr:ferrous iron transport protein B [Deltaproteobacteria bacterium]
MIIEEEKNKSGQGAASNHRASFVIAVAGNPNAGKSTLINAMAGARLQVGNWPGVTVEKKSAEFEYEGRRIILVDLPGTYSLSPYSQEEVIARDYLVHERPDVIINVVDATNLERNLYFTLQLLELEIPLIVALNMYDEAGQKGFRIDTAKMASMLGCAVVPTVATRREGVDRLIETAVEFAESSNRREMMAVSYGEDIEKAVRSIVEDMKQHGAELVNHGPSRWQALKIIETDEIVLDEMGISADDNFLKQATHHLSKAHGEDLETLLADTRYALAAGLTREALKKPETRKRELTERIDAIVLNRYLGIPIFLFFMWLIFKLTFDIAGPFTEWFDAVISGPLTHWSAAVMTLAGAPDWAISLVTEGVIAGVGAVLIFLPPIFAMMFFITFLEGSGYMARAAFVMDRMMHAIGLHGKSFIPLLLGFGCNVPAVYATRTLENPRDKALTALLIPLMSCGARLPVYLLFVGVFFSAYAGTVLWSLYILGIILAVMVGWIFKKTLFRGEAPVFIMELPPYRMPTMTSLLIHTWEKGKHYLIKAGTFILAITICIWFGLNLPWGVESKRDSYLGHIGQAAAPVFAPLGFGTWEAASSLITGVIAKEIVVSTMGEVYTPKDGDDKEKNAPSVSEELKQIGVSFVGAVGKAVGNVFSTFGIATISMEEEEGTESLKTAIKKNFTPLSAYAFMAFVLLYVPCFIVLVAMRHEFGTWKWAGVTIAYQSVLAWTVSFIIYQGGTLIGIG